LACRKQKEGNIEQRSFFTASTENQAGASVNERSRNNETSIFDVVLPDEADIRKYPGGQEVVDQIREFE
jgi:hypothetical protein